MILDKSDRKFINNEKLGFLGGDGGFDVDMEWIENRIYNEEPQNTSKSTWLCSTVSASVQRVIIFKFPSTLRIMRAQLTNIVVFNIIHNKCACWVILEFSESFSLVLYSTYFINISDECDEWAM